MVVEMHMEHLKDITDNVRYENFRYHILASLDIYGKPTNEVFVNKYFLRFNCKLIDIN